jgi:hypothetical protein
LELKQNRKRNKEVVLLEVLLVVGQQEEVVEIKKGKLQEVEEEIKREEPEVVALKGKNNKEKFPRAHSLLVNKLVIHHNNNNNNNKFNKKLN